MVYLIGKNTIYTDELYVLNVTFCILKDTQRIFKNLNIVFFFNYNIP